MAAREEAKGSLSLSGTTGNGDLQAEGNKGPTFKDFGGIKKVLNELERNVVFPILNPEPFKMIPVKPPSGILFHGPPGCGKTKLAHAIANEVDLPLYKISAADVVSDVSGASEKNIRELFSKAYRTAPSIVFIDEIDAIGSKSVTQLLTCMDKNGPDSNAGFVLVIGATNRPYALDPALRRRGRFECEIALSAPDEDARAEILSVAAQKFRSIERPFDKKRIARLTPGFVGADLERVAYLAGKNTIERIMNSRKSEDVGDLSWLRRPWTKEELENVFVKMSDFEEAVTQVTRERFSMVPDVKWDDLGGLDHLRLELKPYIVTPIKKPDICKAPVLDSGTGILLYGPPGCGMTLIAKAAANEAGANFMHIKGAEFLNKDVGESELAIRKLFQRARTCAPCVIFIDEVDALGGEEGACVLVELDGRERRNVYVIGATIRPDVVDPAFLRPERFGKLLYVPFPNADERVSILKAIARKKPIDPSVDLDGIAKMNCEGFIRADLARLVNEAAMKGLEEFILSGGSVTIKRTHFEHALSLVSPSVNKDQKEQYEALAKELTKESSENLFSPFTHDAIRKRQ